MCGTSVKDAKAVHDLLHVMLAALRMAQVAPVQYVSLASTSLEGTALTDYRSLTALRLAMTMLASKFAAGHRQEQIGCHC